MNWLRFVRVRDIGTGRWRKGIAEILEDNYHYTPVHAKAPAPPPLWSGQAYSRWPDGASNVHAWPLSANRPAPRHFFFGFAVVSRWKVETRDLRSSSRHYTVVSISTLKPVVGGLYRLQARQSPGRDAAAAAARSPLWVRC
ncbi:hypothetical protein MTO96_019818 [Rhipicephalus appendiculatus]